MTRELNEPILPDDHPVYQGYLYVVNGDRVVDFIDGENMTVGQWKELRIPGVEPVTEVRRCDLTARFGQRPTKMPTRPESLNGGFPGGRTSFKQKHRKPRNSHKIKKAKSS